MKKHSNTASCGRRGELFAAIYLALHGYKILHRNYYIGRRELDIIAEGREYIVFAEVKTHGTRRDGSFGRPANAVDGEKQKNTLCAAKSYLRYHPTKKQPRIDVIEVWLGGLLPKINHIKNAVRR